MRLRGTSPPPAPRRNAGARLRTRSSSNGGIATTAAATVDPAPAAIGTVAAVPNNGDTDASDGGGGGGVAVARHMPRPKDEPHESRSGSPVDRAVPSGRGDGDGRQQQQAQVWAATLCLHCGSWMRLISALQQAVHCMCCLCSSSWLRAEPRTDSKISFYVHSMSALPRLGICTGQSVRMRRWSDLLGHAGGSGSKIMLISVLRASFFEQHSALRHVPLWFSLQEGASGRPWPADGGAGNAVSIGERLGSGGGSSVSGEQQRQQEGAELKPAARGLAHPGDALEGSGGLERVVRVPKHQRSARTPRAAPAPALPGVYARKSSSLAVPTVSDSGADAPATPRSPSKGDRGRDSGAGARTPRARAAGEHSGFSGGGEERLRERPADKTVRRGSGGGESGGRDSDAGKTSAAAAALRTAASGSLDGRPSSQRDHPASRDQQPHSPRSGGGSGGASARASLKSPVKSPRPRDGSAGKGASLLSVPLLSPCRA